MLYLDLYLVDVTAVVGGVGDSVSWNIIICRNPTHSHHAVCDQWKLNLLWWWEGDCGEKMH